MSMVQLLQTNAQAAPAKPRPRVRLLPYLLSLPALLVCVAILVPFVTAAVYSLQRYRLNLPYLRGFIGAGNYIDFLSDPAFWNTFRVSITYTALTVVLELLLGLGIALLLRRPTRFHNAVSIMLLLPLMTAPAIAALMWKLMTNPSFGILSYLVGLFGVTDFKWASDPSSALFTVVLVDVWVYTPFIMILLLAGLRSLPRQPFEAAALDGVPRHFVFFRITLPLLWESVQTAWVYLGIVAMDMFVLVSSMTQNMGAYGGGPDHHSDVMSTVMMRNFQYFGKSGYACAMGVVMLLLTLVLSVVMLRATRRDRVEF